MRRFRDAAHTPRLLPSCSALPAAAYLDSWPFSDVALFVLTGGLFDPRREDQQRGLANLVSVCVPTSTRRHAFHQLLYHNFKQQTHSPKELVVVDTGTGPSKYLEAMAKQDSEVIYRFYPVQDSKQDRQAALLRAAQQALRRQAKELPVGYEPAANSWTLGLKRNLAARLASGKVIAHFDDDDLYSADYLEFMVSELRDRARKTNRGRDLQGAALDEVPAIVTLKEWHLFDFASRQFRHLDPATDPDVLESWRSPMMFGYGFSYVYTRAAWELQPFPDREDCEDDVFMQELQRKSQDAVGLVSLPSKDRGLVAHSFHLDNTGMSEFNGSKRLGQRVERPRAFDALMVQVEDIAARLPRRPQEPTFILLAGPGPRLPPHLLGKGRGKGLVGRGTGAQNCGPGRKLVPWPPTGCLPAQQRRVV